MALTNVFPGGSKSRINRAGEHFKNGNATAEDNLCLDEWRKAHRAVLNTFQAILRNRTRMTDISVAQRHKRKKTIIDKLSRIPGMLLSRMDDVAGCRLIFKNIKDLYKFRKEFHKARFYHHLKNEGNIDKYDYIKKPKSTGYRGIHDVYEYDVASEIGKKLKGLQIELQYRTILQHTWATTVEVIGHVTKNQPKFQKGDKRYETVMAFASEILARAFEKLKGPFPDIDNKELVANFNKLDTDLHLLTMLKGLNISEAPIIMKKHILLIFSKRGILEIRTYKDSRDALNMLFKIENDRPEDDPVLVRADSKEEVRLAYKNYFSDAKDFIKKIESGCEKLLKLNQ